MGKRATKAPELDQSRPRSLRLRLMLWYGTLLVVALGFFGTLFLVLTIEAINQSVDSAVHAETRVASLEVARELSPTPPYWPAHLSLSTIDTFREQGVMVEIVDTRGNMRYPAATGTGRNRSDRANHSRLHGTRHTPWQPAPASIPSSWARRDGTGGGYVQRDACLPGERITDPAPLCRSCFARAACP